MIQIFKNIGAWIKFFRVDQFYLIFCVTTAILTAFILANLIKSGHNLLGLGLFIFILFISVSIRLGWKAFVAAHAIATLIYSVFSILDSFVTQRALSTKYMSTIGSLQSEIARGIGNCIRENPDKSVLLRNLLSTCLGEPVNELSKTVQKLGVSIYTRVEIDVARNMISSTSSPRESACVSLYFEIEPYCDFYLTDDQKYTIRSKGLN